MSWQARFDSIRRHKLFEVSIILVIITSAILVGAKTYDIPLWLAQTITVLDWLITLIFMMEISIRFLAEHPHTRFFRDPWNWFDTLIVAVSLIPIDNTDMALVARLVRVFRVLRMVSFVPELRMLMNSLLLALPRLGYVMALMFIIFYIYGAVGSLIFGDINETLWGDISISMLTLFRVMTFEDWTDVMYETMAVYGWSWLYYVSFIFLTAFAFLNMVIGIVVNVLETEHEKMKDEDPEQTSANQLHREIQELKQLVLELQKK